MRLKPLFLFMFVLFLLPPTFFGQQTERPLIAKMKVLYIHETSLAEGVADAYRFVDYEVLRVCSGNLKRKKYRIAHIIASTKGLKLNDIVYNKLRLPKEHKDLVQDLEADGIDTSGYMAPDFIFAGRQKSCSIVE